MSARITIETVSPQVIRVTLVADIQISTDLGAFARSGNGDGTLVPEDTDSPKPQLVTVEEAAEILCIGRDKVYYLIRTGQLRSIKIGKLRRISTEWIADLIVR